MFDAGRQEDEVVLAYDVILPGDLHQPLAFEHVVDLLLHKMLVARDMLAKTAASLPVGRVGASEDIARQILSFMANGFATGSIVYIDGGALVI